MPVQNPQPWFASFLVAALPGAWLLGLGIARRAIRDAALATLLAPGVGACAWLLLVHTIGVVTRSFGAGMWSGTLLAGALGFAWRAHDARRGLALLPRSDRPRAWGTWIGAVLATLVVAPAALGWVFHDETFLTGHLSIAAEMQNGIYPPRHLVFAQFPLRYHFGFDLLTALLGTLFRLRNAVAIDVGTLAGWFYSWFLLAALGQKLLGPRRGLVTPAVTLFGGGVPFLLGEAQRPEFVNRLLGVVTVHGAAAGPPLASNFFQHPWALGVPVALCASLAWLDLGVTHRDDVAGCPSDAGSPSRTSVAMLGVLLLALSLAQIVVFLTFLGAMLGTQLVLSCFRRTSTAAPTPGRIAGRALPAVGFAVLVLAGAKMLGGFFTGGSGQDGTGLRLDAWSQTGSAWGNILWNVATLGLLLPVGIWGFFLLRASAAAASAGHGSTGTHAAADHGGAAQPCGDPEWQRRAWMFFAFVAAGSLAVANGLGYAHSWDIVKFESVAAIALAIPASAAVAKVFSLRPRALGSAVGLVALVLAMAPGLCYHAVFALRMDGVPAFFWKETARLDGEDVRVVEWLRRHVAAGEIVYRNKRAALGYAQWGGLPQAITDGAMSTYGIREDLLSSRRQFLRGRFRGPDDFIRQGIRWLVLDPSDAQLAALVQDWQRQGTAELAMRSGSLSVFRLV